MMITERPSEDEIELNCCIYLNCSFFGYNLFCLLLSLYVIIHFLLDFPPLLYEAKVPSNWCHSNFIPIIPPEHP